MLLTETKQCWGFIIGSAFFAVATVPGIDFDAQAANVLCFIGAWFFTGAGLIQLFLSGSVWERLASRRRMVRAEWLTASTQSCGTILFNVSTISALFAVSHSADERLVWSPDAGGSLLFLVSGCFAFVAYASRGKLWDFSDRDWWSTLINFAGCVAFAVSAIGAYVQVVGRDFNAALASGGTFVGALCFLVAAAVALPARAVIVERPEQVSE